ncbi:MULTISPECIES: hypothetical protein [unclassified Mesorhizobium]|uniref:hypothetical protein n=1 Tax=unclassified Mesorhizobium TaxID=325217 RepID=UPI001AC00A10|nr:MULTISPECIES: hypothetical protein [unclassified Mesorhizobium]
MAELTGCKEIRSNSRPLRGAHSLFVALFESADALRDASEVEPGHVIACWKRAG